MKWLLAAALAAFSCLVPAQDHNHHPPAVIGATVTAKDTIPDFAGAPTIWTVQSGAWQDPATWNLKRVPTIADVCNIEEEHVVSFSGNGECGDIGGRGVLNFDRHANSRLRFANLLAYRAGRVIAGTAQQPMLGRLELEIVSRPIDYANDPLQFGTSLIVFGELKMHGAPKTAWVALAKEAKAGDTTLTLKSAPQGWQAGDKLVLPDTRQWSIVRKASTAPEVPVALRIEEPVVASVSGNVVTLSAPLQHDHPGGRDSSGNVVSMGHVGNLTRNIVIRSENPTGTRGHALFTERAAIDIQHVAFEGMGRTTSAPLSSGPGGNQIGRYPAHMHHLMGPRNASNTGYQFIFSGNVMTDCRKWCLAVHNSHWGQVSDNVMYGATGSGIMTEQANERGNEFDRNLAVKIGTPIVNAYHPIYGGVRTDFKDFGWEGSCYWFGGNDNYVRGNVCANASYAGVMYNGRACGGFAHCHPLVPKFRGADIAIADEWDDHKKLNKAQPPIIESHGNEVYASAVGAWVSFAGNVGTFRDFLGWHLSQSGVYTSRSGWAHYENIRLINDPLVSKLQQSEASLGLNIGSPTYNSGRLTWRNVVIEGFNVGIELPANREVLSATLYPGVDARVMEFANVSLKNYVNVWDMSAHQAAPKITNFRSSTFSSYGEKPASTALLPDGQKLPDSPRDFMGSTGSNIPDNWLTSLSQLMSYDHQKSGFDVEFFLPEQSPDFVMPERLYRTQRLANLNCPTAGMTNAQCMAAHGVATMGRVATCTATHPTVTGFLCGSVVTPPPPPPPPPPADDYEFAVGGRKYTVQDAGAATADDATLRLKGVEYTVR